MKKGIICIFQNSNLFLINNKLYFVLFIWLNIIFPINTGCPKGIGIGNENCFNDLIKNIINPGILPPIKKEI